MFCLFFLLRKEKNIDSTRLIVLIDGTRLVYMHSCPPRGYAIRRFCGKRMTGFCSRQISPRKSKVSGPSQGRVLSPFKPRTDRARLMNERRTSIRFATSHANYSATHAVYTDRGGENIGFLQRWQVSTVILGFYLALLLLHYIHNIVFCLCDGHS